MEQKRILVAVVLSFIVLLVWQKFFIDTKTVNPEGPEQAVVQAVVPVGEIASRATAGGGAATPSYDGGSAIEEAEPPEIITVNTPLYQVSISEKGAVFQSFKLKNYRETVDKSSDLKELVSQQNFSGTLISGFSGHSVPGLSDAVFSSQAPSNSLHVTDSPVKVIFRWQSRNGVLIEKAYVFSPETYSIDLVVTVNNQSDSTIADHMTLSLIDTISGKDSTLGFTGPSVMVDDKVVEIKSKNFTEKNQFTGNITWAAFQDQYFMASIIPTAAVSATVEFSLKEASLFESKIVMSETIIPPNSKAEFTFQTYFGPKNISILKGIGHRLEKVVDFGMFDFLARPCLSIMNFLYRFIPNYGIAIILLTIFIKALLWPLGQKSYKSMSQMKKMQPLMADIRERYKDDKQKMNVELMSLYKTYKVNPLGGCLPMLAQLPVFFAFYRMLYQAVELRHAPFVGWINDLSAPDRLFDFGISHLPFMQAPYGIPVLTLIMGATSLIQQKMQPPMGDPAQAKMMMLMPIVFTVIFVNFPAGLVLYWLVNNILSIVQQYYVSKKTT